MLCHSSHDTNNSEYFGDYDCKYHEEVQDEIPDIKAQNLFHEVHGNIFFMIDEFNISAHCVLRSIVGPNSYQTELIVVLLFALNC